MSREAGVVAWFLKQGPLFRSTTFKTGGLVKVKGRGAGPGQDKPGKGTKETNQVKGFSGPAVTWRL